MFEVAVVVSTFVRHTESNPWGLVERTYSHKVKEKPVFFPWPCFFSLDVSLCSGVVMYSGYEPSSGARVTGKSFSYY